MSLDIAINMYLYINICNFKIHACENKILNVLDATIDGESVCVFYVS